MGEKTVLEKIKELIGKIAYRLLLWSLNMTEKEYLIAIYKQEKKKE